MTSWHQVEIQLPPFPRGFHIITAQIEDAVKAFNQLKVGTLHIFIKHTSASIAINEGADPSVRVDFETHFNKLVPENSSDFIHNAEGPDDMPAHIKTVLIGESLTVPVRDGALALGTWQGLYLCEHRDHAGSRRVVATLQGERR